MDQIRTRRPSAVIALASTLEGRASLLVSVGPGLQQELDAGALLKAMLPHIDGRGGGKGDLAQGGGAKSEGLGEAFRALRGTMQMAAARRDERAARDLPDAGKGRRDG